VQKAALLLAAANCHGLAHTLTLCSGRLESPTAVQEQEQERCQIERSKLETKPEKHDRSRFSRPEGPGQSNCREPDQPFWPLHTPLSGFAVYRSFAIVRAAPAALQYPFQHPSPPASIIRQRTAHRQ
jgi:hypothetical protein